MVEAKSLSLALQPTITIITANDDSQTMNVGVSPNITNQVERSVGYFSKMIENLGELYSISPINHSTKSEEDHISEPATLPS